MKNKIETIKKTRLFLLTIISELNTDQLNKIPEGFNNNIIWNLGHLVAAQQGICYMRSAVKLSVEEKFFSEFKPGTKPERVYDSVEIESIKKLLIETLDKLESDYSDNLFKNYTVVTTRYGVELKNIDDAIDFLPFHEGMHSGYIMALKRVVNKQ
jgi:hypothetical protein